MRKAIYAIFGDIPCQIRQKDKDAPLILIQGKNELATSFDSVAKQACVRVDLWSDNAESMYTNNEALDTFLTYLEEKKVTKLQDVFESYKMTIDYVVIDQTTRKPIDQGILIEEVKVEDGIYPLGCDKDNRLVYRMVKKFTSRADLLYRRTRSLGIVYDVARSTSLLIKNITIFANRKPDVSPADFYENMHPAHTNVTLSADFDRYGPSTTSLLKEMIPVYDLCSKGLRFKEIQFPERPRRIDVPITVTLNEIIVAYDESAVNAILKANQEVVVDPDPIVPDVPGSDCDCGCDCDDNIERLDQSIANLRNEFNQYVISDEMDVAEEKDIDAIFDDTRL